MSTDWEAVRERVAAHVGRVQVRELGTLTEREIERFAVAAGFPGTDGEAHPLHLSAVLGWDPGPAESALREDGSGPADLAGVPVDGLRLMGAGQDLEFGAPVRAGTSVAVHTSLDTVDLKSGRSGALLVMTFLRRYLDGAGAELLRCRETFIAR